MTVLTALAVQNAEVLRALSAGGFGNVGGLARLIGRDADNLRKSLKALEREGLIDIDGAPGHAIPVLIDLGHRTLAALDRAEAPAAPAGFRTFVHAELAPDRLNPRKTFDLDDEAALASAILDAGRIQQNLTVRPPAEPGAPFRIVSGERRWRAVGRLIEQGDVGADYPLPCAVRDLDDAQALTEAVMENLARRDLPPLEEAQAFRRLMELHEMGTADIARRVGRTQRHVQVRLQVLAELPPEDLADLEGGLITWEQARERVRTPKAAAPEPQAEVVEPIEQLTERAPAPAALKPDLRPTEYLRLVEVRAKYSATGSGFFAGSVDATQQIYLDRDWGNLIKAGLAMTSMGDGHIGASVTPRGCRLLAEAHLAPEIHADAHFAALAAMGWPSERIRETEQSGRYATDWLNTPTPAAAGGDDIPAAVPSPAPAPRPASPSAPERPSAGLTPPAEGMPEGEDDEDARQAAEAAEILAKVRAGIATGLFGNNGQLHFRDLADAAGIAGPFRANTVEAGCVSGAEGHDAAVCDHDRELPDALATARAELIAFALNAACGHSHKTWS
ncbi:ParB/RepB/Spo0J family partition protein [Phenylobacterium sp.]|jgi:ParB/RepB/Spo0J family partition protein|uniref:ParB/RepB/Spo0J family partition protein n=1 Tax=Phenylobacterium sp. TaxID=1871053 RepID=UPI002F403FB5